MESSSYVILSRNRSLNNKIDSVTSNVANANSDGYNKNVVVFDDYLHESNGKSTSFPTDVFTFLDVSIGPLRHTGSSLNVAISIPGIYFAVKTPSGFRYTRSGAFTLSDGGVLMKSGYPVLSEDGGEIYIDNSLGSNFLFSADGEIVSQNSVFGKIGVFRVENPHFSMIKEGSDLLKFTGDGEPEIVEHPMLKSGYLEGSNSIGINEMSELNSAMNDNKMVMSVYNDIEKMLNESVRDLVGMKPDKGE